jgi:DNA end-binding protein Ku
MAARSLWSGSINFGLVNIPVKLFPAVKDTSVRFHLLHDQDKVRLQRKMVCPADGKEVHPEHVVKGYEVAKDQYVVVQQSEIKSCAPEATRSIEITDFVDLSEIDPVYYERPYYLLPDKGAAKPYRLLLEAMKKSKKVGIARFVMRDKEYLAALRPVGDVVCIETMHFGEEVVATDELEGVPGDVKLNDRELKVAQQLIDSLATKFDPRKYHDTFKDCVMKLVDQKARGEKVHISQPREKRPDKAVDLMAALEASLKQAKAKAGAGVNGDLRRKRKSA